MAALQRLAGASALALFLAVATTPALAGVSVQAAEAACRAGQAVDAGGPPGESVMPRSGPTPTRAKGAVTVSLAEARCLTDKLGERLLVVQAMGQDQFELPGAQRLPRAGVAAQEAFEADLGALSQDRNRPVLFYCHHERCQLSYNASLRAAQAGYRHVYWMREGNRKWYEAGLPLRGETPDPQGVVPRVRQAVASCEAGGQQAARHNFVLAILVEGGTAGAEHDGLRRAVGFRKTCLKPLVEAWAPNPPALALASRALADTEKEVERHYAAVRDDAARDPAKAFASVLRVKVADMKAVLQRADAYGRAPEQACGRLHRSVPRTQADVERLNRGITRHYQCLQANMPGGMDDGGRNAAERRETREREEAEITLFRDVAQAYVGLERYTCGRHAVSGCIPDAAWREMTAVANPANARRAIDESLTREKRRDAYYDASEETNRWVAEMNRHVTRLNNQGGGGAPVYQAPTYELPQGQRRSFDRSVPGVR